MQNLLRCQRAARLDTNSRAHFSRPAYLDRNLVLRTLSNERITKRFLETLMHISELRWRVCLSALFMSCALASNQAYAQQFDDGTHGFTLRIAGAVKASPCMLIASVNEGPPNANVKVAPIAQRANSVSGVAYFSVSLRDQGNADSDCLSTNKLSAIQFDTTSQNTDILGLARADRQALNATNLTVELLIFNNDWTQSTVVNQKGTTAYNFMRAAGFNNSAPNAANEKLNFAIRYTASSSDGLVLRPGDLYVTLPFVIGLN